MISDVINQKYHQTPLQNRSNLSNWGKPWNVSRTRQGVRERQSFGCSAWIILKSSMTSYVARDWNVRWTYESRHRIIELFRSDRSYSLCHVCSPLCPGNAQAFLYSFLAEPEVCRRLSHCVQEWETMGGIADRRSDQTRRGEVSEKPW